ncbi:hypothetical protein CJ030_MR1G007877 [Morella rubra]|uniref:DUF4219 domain-containing protein n=1 Tax=Morella rubra TaxID=262757 RepID=A0A6A1WNI2_9ROSI|nr:hypothetical protein CJ030_MR1G007877 [Morella rubra]
MEAKATLCKTALEVLDKDNYISWSVQVKTYLMAQDLWDVIEVATESSKEKDDEANRKARSKKNFMALHVIQNSCGPESFYKIRKISGSRGFIRSINEGNWDALHRYLIRDNMTALNAKINDLDETPLHMAVTKGHVHIVEKLVALMSKEDLEIKDSSGMTAMARASALVGADTRMLMHEKNENVTIPDLKGLFHFK